LFDRDGIGQQGVECRRVGVLKELKILPFFPPDVVVQQRTETLDESGILGRRAGVVHAPGRAGPQLGVLVQQTPP
jgi:hypothetical protein